MNQGRQTAYKVFIGDLLSGEFVEEKGEWDPNYILIKDKKVSRVNIIANVISKYEAMDKNYASLDIDDGSGVISLKSWKEDVSLLEKIKIGDLILIIGRARQTNNQVYVSPEIIKIFQDFKWGRLRRLELEQFWGKREEIKTVKQEEKTNLVVTEENVNDVTESARQRVLNIIERNEVDLKRLIELSSLNPDEVKVIVQTLLKEGEIYEPKPGVLKLV